MVHERIRHEMRQILEEDTELGFLDTCVHKGRFARHESFIAMLA